MTPKQKFFLLKMAKMVRDKAAKDGTPIPATLEEIAESLTVVIPKVRGDVVIKKEDKW